MTQWFSETYPDARDRIIHETSKAGGWAHESLVHPATGPDGGEIATDVFWRGPRDAAKVLVLCSGTHGVEGFTGSAIQSRFAASDQTMPEDCAVMMIHAVNPYGFAHLRRVNEDNVDLNRNFIDFAKGVPANKGYRDLRDVVNPVSWNPDTSTQIGRSIAKMMAEMPYLEFLKAISGGQYEFADGIQFGGTAPTWSRRTLEEIWRRYLDRAKLVVQLDIHTGLGPNGAGVLMMAANDDEPHKQITSDWFGEMMVTGRPASASDTVLGGYMNAGLEDASESWVMPMTLEYGTLDPLPVLLALIEDNWLSNHGDPASAQGQQVRERVLRAFYPLDEEWRTKIIHRADTVIDQAIAGMSQLDLAQYKEAQA